MAGKFGADVRSIRHIDKRETVQFLKLLYQIENILEVELVRLMDLERG
ncbi:MAG: hypothetical protein RLP14_10395 [Owenweeksia sp.]